MTTDNITGVWHGTKNIPFLASGNCEITFHEDNTGKATGQVHALGKKYTFNECFTWQNLGGGKYIGRYGEYQVGFTLNPAGTEIKTVINIYKLGVMSSPVYNQDITITLYR